jgi:hypothetical protein
MDPAFDDSIRAALRIAPEVRPGRDIKNYAFVNRY